MEIGEAKALLSAANIFFDPDDEMPPQTLNLNDVFGWACADCETVPDAEMPRLGSLFYRYGWCGILFWVRERRGGWSEFHDNNRFIEFVCNEERIRSEHPGSTDRAYFKTQYTIGGKR